MKKSLAYVPDIREDKRPTYLQAPVNGHDLFQLRLVRALKKRPLEVMTWLGAHSSDVQQRLALLPQMVSLANAIDDVIANFDIKGFADQVTDDSDVASAIVFAWEKHSIRALEKKAASLRVYGVEFAVEVPLTDAANSAEPALSAFLPPAGYLDIVIDIDTPFLRFKYPGAHLRADIISLATEVGNSPFVTTSLHYLWPASWLLALDNAYLPLGLIVRSGTDSGDTLLARATEILNADQWIASIRKKLKALLATRSRIAGYHQHLALELKTGQPPVELLWGQLSKYEKAVCDSHHLSAEFLSGAKADDYADAYRIRQDQRLISDLDLTPNIVRRIWRFGPPIGYSGEKKPGSYSVETHGAAVWTTQVVVFPDDYVHKHEANSHGITVIPNANSILNKRDNRHH